MNLAATILTISLPGYLTSGIDTDYSIFAGSLIFIPKA
jgi:hypothetical protein